MQAPHDGSPLGGGLWLDFRCLNSLCEHIQSDRNKLLWGLPKKKYWTSIDLKQGYQQLELSSSIRSGHGLDSLLLVDFTNIEGPLLGGPIAERIRRLLSSYPNSRLFVIIHITSECGPVGDESS